MRLVPFCPGSLLKRPVQPCSKEFAPSSPTVRASTTSPTGVRVTGAQNVGGTGASNVAATIHGGRSDESIMLLDGMRYNQGSGVGGIRNGYNENDGSVEEITFETAALLAETEVGGVVRNIV